MKPVVLAILIATMLTTQPAMAESCTITPYPPGSPEAVAEAIAALRYPGTTPRDCRQSAEATKLFRSIGVKNLRLEKGPTQNCVVLTTTDDKVTTICGPK